MSLLRETPAAELKEKHGLVFFVETGCGDGDGLKYAKEIGFEHRISCDTKPESVEACAAFGVVHCLPSTEFLRWFNAFPALFWLDAHFPAKFSSTGDNWPLLDELKILATKQGIERCVVIADDMHCVQDPDNPTREDGPGHDWEPVGGTIAELKETLAKTHTATLLPVSTGLLIFEPKA